MKPRIEAPRRMDMPHLTSSGINVTQDIGVSPQPEVVGARLLDHYGISLFELLVVDTEYVFISWELTPEQISKTQAQLSKADWAGRRLMVRLLEASSGELLQQSELYGEAGRWFIRLQRCGIALQAELGWHCPGSFAVMHRAGPVAVPRDYMVEPEAYDELSVQYHRGPDGKLGLRQVSREPDASWPQITLPQPEILEEHELAPRTLPEGVQSWVLGSGVGLRTLVITPGGRASLPRPQVSSLPGGALDLPSSASHARSSNAGLQLPETAPKASGSATPREASDTGPNSSATVSRDAYQTTQKAQNKPSEMSNVPVPDSAKATGRSDNKKGKRK